MPLAVHMKVCPGSSLPTVPNHPELPSAAFAVGSQVLVFPELLPARTFAAASSKLSLTGSMSSLLRGRHALVVGLAVSPCGITQELDVGLVRSGGPPQLLMFAETSLQVRVPL